MKTRWGMAVVLAMVATVGQVQSAEAPAPAGDPGAVEAAATARPSAAPAAAQGREAGRARVNAAEPPRAAVLLAALMALKGASRLQP